MHRIVVVLIVICPTISVYLYLHRNGVRNINWPIKISMNGINVTIRQCNSFFKFYQDTCVDFSWRFQAYVHFSSILKRTTAWWNLLIQIYVIKQITSLLQ